MIAADGTAGRGGEEHDEHDRRGVIRLVRRVEGEVRLGRFHVVRGSLLVTIIVVGCHGNVAAPRAPIHVDVTRGERDATTPAAEAENEKPARSEGMRIAGALVELEPPRHKDVATYCAARVASEDQAQRSSGLWAHLSPAGATCREVTLPVPYHAAAAFPVVHAIKTVSPLHDERTTLFVETPDGLAATGIEWDWENPTVGQSPQNPATLEELRVEHGRLLAIVGRRQGWMATDGTAELALLRAAVACERRDRVLRCLRFYPDESINEAPLGMKRTPYSTPRAWSDLAWDRSPSVRLEGDQLVVVDR